MPRFVNKADTKTIRAEWWDDGEEVVIRKFSHGQRQKLAMEYFKIEGSVESGSAETFEMVNLAEMNMETLLLGIVSWTFQDEAGKDVPVNRQAVFNLVDEDGNFILKAINEFNKKQRTAEEQESFQK